MLSFAFIEGVPFAINLAERDLRPVTVKQKVSGCFRTLHGAQVYARLQRYHLHLSQARQKCVCHFFSFSGAAERDQLKAAGIGPQKLYPTGTLYQKLQAQGVCSTVFQHREYTPSIYSNILFEGAAARGRNYFFFYYDKIDSVSHDYGPASRQVEAEIDLFPYALERFFFSTPLAKGRTLLLLTANHGQSEIDPATTVYLTRAFPQIGQFLKTNRKGEFIVPGGSCRDMFLYVTACPHPGLRIMTRETDAKTDFVAKNATSPPAHLPTGRVPRSPRTAGRGWVDGKECARVNDGRLSLLA